MQERALALPLVFRRVEQYFGHKRAVTGRVGDDGTEVAWDGICPEGELYLELDDGKEVKLTPSTCVVQQGTRHAWHTLSATDAAKAKWWSAQVQNDVLDACVQLHGGYGYMTEYRVARAWTDARVTKIWAGSNEIMKELIGRDLDL